MYTGRLILPSTNENSLKPCGFTVYPNDYDKLIYYNLEAY